MEELKVVPKVPYKFSYKLEDDSGRQFTMMIEDWEIGMLYFHCLRRANGDESAATKRSGRNTSAPLSLRDLYFFLGATKKFHKITPNPFIIVGAFYPQCRRRTDKSVFLTYSNHDDFMEQHIQPPPAGSWRGCAGFSSDKSPSVPCLFLLGKQVDDQQQQAGPGHGDEQAVEVKPADGAQAQHGGDEPADAGAHHTTILANAPMLGLFHDHAGDPSRQRPKSTM